MRTRGLLIELGPGASAGETRALWELVSRRGEYDYDDQPDFFTSDIVDTYAQGLYRLGAELGKAGRFDEARDALMGAWSTRWLLPEAPAYLAYMAFTRRDFPEARRLYGEAESLGAKLVDLAHEYRSLPGVAENGLRERAENLMHLGVVSEKLGRADEARSFYERSFAVYPLAQAHYNYAVLFWGRDWAVAERELVEALRLDPRHAEAGRYLAILRARARRGG
jgi:tetratricopeptide (TPR) repeat protein